MLKAVVNSIFGSSNGRKVKRLRLMARAINVLEPECQKLTDEQLATEFSELRKRHAGGESLDDLLVEAFALVREAGVRALGLRHFDVQMMGGIALHQGNIAEMPTGEGKTLVATLPASLNALASGVHIVTVNDYLARRDAQWMQPLYEMLGLRVGYVISDQETEEKHEAYRCDITYATNNELGFDYLRDNMVLRKDHRVQNKLTFAIIDEVDSILIDEARTPLIISGAANDNAETYKAMTSIAPQLLLQKEDELGEVITEGDYVLDEKGRSVNLTDLGHEKVELLLAERGMIDSGASLYDSNNLPLMHHVISALRAHTLFQKDVHYIVQNDQVVIIDEHTGRPMPGRRWSDGLHQAVEAREGVSVQQESQTLASTSFQNYFRQYDKLAGMTGTADTEAFEFNEIYGLDVVVIPPNKPSAREDHNDHIYLSISGKYKAILEDIRDCCERGQPVLVGTASIESSELLSKALSEAKIEHDLLNAKQPEREAGIISQAGKPSKVTIATNMAGRGTDIVLGGNLETALLDVEDEAEKQKIEKQWQELHDAVIAAGGLHVIGTERHESRRIDNQLRGRSGRQGDPGSSRFFLSLDDDLMRIFASDRIRGLMSKMGLPEDEAIDHKMVTNAIERAQRKVEARNFDMRKQLLEYDDVANEQRTVIYAQRNQLLEQESLDEMIASFISDACLQTVYSFMPQGSAHDHWRTDELDKTIERELDVEPFVTEFIAESPQADEQDVLNNLTKKLEAIYHQRFDGMEEDLKQQVQRQIVLQVIDNHWQNHLRQLDYLRQGVHLRSYAQKNPRQEYKREAFNMFQNLLSTVRLDSVRLLMHLQIKSKEEAEEMDRKRVEEQQKREMHMAHGSEDNESKASNQGRVNTFVRDKEKVGRNQPCPCGSGKKYKHCHGKL